MKKKYYRISNFNYLYENVMNNFMYSYNKIVNLVEDSQNCKMMYTNITEQDLDNLSMIQDILQMIKCQICVEEHELNDEEHANIYKAAFIDGIAWSNGIEMNDEYYENLHRN